MILRNPTRTEVQLHDELETLQKECDRMREALVQFEDRRNWERQKYTERCVWIGEKLTEPWLLARKGLGE